VRPKFGSKNPPAIEPEDPARTTFKVAFPAFVQRILPVSMMDTMLGGNEIITAKKWGAWYIAMKIQKGKL